MRNTAKTDECKDNSDEKQLIGELSTINHRRHFAVTILTFGIWGLVWWWLILRSEGKHKQIFSGFDDAYWSYLIEREQPPAALHKMSFAKNEENTKFDA